MWGAASIAAGMLLGSVLGAVGRGRP
jgi:hypothetical protein